MKKDKVFQTVLHKAVFLCLIALLLTGSVNAEGIAVRVNDRNFTTETVQKYINESAINMQLTVGTTVQALFGETPEEYLEAAAEHFVTVAIVESKLHDAGLDSLTDDEENGLREYAREMYEQIWQEVLEALKKEFPDETYTERAVTETMEAAGYSIDGIYEKARQNLFMDRITDLYCVDLTVTEEEVREFYRQSYVLPDREKYEGNVPLFESEILFGGGTSTYVPEGYFYIKYILLNPSEERGAAISETQAALQTAEEEAAEIHEMLLGEALKEDADLSGLREKALDAEQAEVEARSAAEEQLRLAETDYAPMIDLIRTAMNDGESFESLIAKHSVQPAYTSPEEPGFPFHPDSAYWDEEIRTGISGLKQYGDCTEPLCTNGMIYIICRMDDMAGGEFEPDEATWQSLRDTMLQARQSKALDDLVQTWRSEYTIETDLSGLIFPEN